jgi:ribosomal protein L11 methyltransferase
LSSPSDSSDDNTPKPTPSPGNGWQVTLTAPAVLLPDAADVLERAGAAISAFEEGEGGRWRLAGYFAAPPDRAALARDLAALSVASDVDLTLDAVTPLPARDWVTETKRAFPPLVVGAFYIHGAHHAGPVPDGLIGLRMEAGTAFGSGEHATTRGCLEALTALAREHGWWPEAPVLDLGAGSGILAIAAAKLWRASVLAVDSDPVAVTAATRNVAANDAAARVTVVESLGLAAPAIGRTAPFDLVLANILANPLVAMAEELTAALSPRGVAVLSGLLSGQAPHVARAYRCRGLEPRAFMKREEWTTIVLVHPQGPLARGRTQS